MLINNLPIEYKVTVIAVANDLVERWHSRSGLPLPNGEQVADVVVFLASDRASHISGTTITVDGGASSR